METLQAATGIAETPMIRAEHELDSLPAMGAPGTRADSLPTADEPTAEADRLAAIDREAFQPPPDASGYRLDLPEGELSADTLAEAQAIRQAFHAVSLPTALAREFSRQFSESAKSPPDAMQLEVARQAGLARLTNKYGDGLQEVLASARQVFDSMCKVHPGLRDLSDRSGLSCSPWVVETLATLGRVRR